MSFSLNCEHMTLFIESLNYNIYNKIKFRNRSSLIEQFMVEISENKFSTASDSYV
jgi:hypothetical protein